MNMVELAKDLRMRRPNAAVLVGMYSGLLPVIRFKETWRVSCDNDTTIGVNIEVLIHSEEEAQELLAEIEKLGGK